MDVISFRMLLETVTAEPGEKHLEGNVTDFESFMSHSTLQKLEQQHAGLFAFLAFHPLFDPAVAAYARSGSLSHDSGPKILVLMVLDENAQSIPEAHKIDVPGVKVSATEHSAYSIVRMLFEGRQVPPLPGLLLFESFVRDTPSVFVSLDGLQEEGIRSRLRRVFEIGSDVYKRSRIEIADGLGVALAKADIPYEKSQRLSIAEWLIKAWKLARDNKEEIFSLALTVAGAKI
jgi:hypothetical protein